MGQTQYEGKIGNDEKVVIVAMGPQIVLSDSMLIFANMTEDEAWHQLLEFLEAHLSEL